MYTITSIYKKWKLSKAKIEALLVEHNVKPVHQESVELSSMVYMAHYTVQAKYYNEDVIEDIFKDIPLRS